MPVSGTTVSRDDAAPMSESFETDDAAPEVPEGGLLRTLPIINRRGLHARASAKFVQTVERFSAIVTVTRAGETVGGRSIMGLLTLGAAQGTAIFVTAVGEDAEAALDAIGELLANRFGEDE
ncbi:hypothetical protein HPGCJGGD_2546 [Methylobacterium haplocladii]|nr:hypothetical protein HPGCJGGD_2546 [Methylobacterium haplocladii]